MKLYNQEGPPNSKEPHVKAQRRMYDMIKQELNPQEITLEKIYLNPWNRTGDPKYDWKFDVYFNYFGRKIAIEIDDKHKLTRTVLKKREHKINYLATKEIELFAFPRKWIVGKKVLPLTAFIEEMGFI